jgi:3-dehydroquinate dehydratase type I
MAEALAGLPLVRQQADCLEFRLDLFEEAFDLEVLLRERGDLPAVVTLRPPHQGGKSPLPPAERLKVLVQAAQLGAEYIDLEYDAASPEAVGALKAAGARVMISRHDFSSMPRNLADGWWPDVAALGADVVKVVGTACDVRDCLLVFRAFARADRPTVAIAMGDVGLLSRVLALREQHCLLTFAALDQGASTAPGQLTAPEMRQVYAADRLRTSTRVYGLLGPHVEQDRLREYNAWFAADAAAGTVGGADGPDAADVAEGTVVADGPDAADVAEGTDDGVEGVAVPFLAEADAAEIVSAFRELPVSGWHIHGPDLQVNVVKALDQLAPSAARQNKVNAVARDKDGTLRGHWVESPREQYEVWRSASG